MKHWVLGFLLMFGVGCREPVLRDINEFFRTTPDECANCRVPAGEQHECGRTRWCNDCRVDVGERGHIHNETRWCRIDHSEEVVGFHDE